MVLEQAYSTTEARLRVEFDIGGERHQYWIQYRAPDTDRGIGWHRDGTEPKYGPVHRQVEFPDGTTTREAADRVTDEHPYRSFERRLAGLPDALT